MDLAESFSLKKTRDKNSILDSEMSDWMLSSVQKAQIGKTSAGTAMLTTGGLSQHVKMPHSSIVTEFNDSIKKTAASPTKMLPFDTFHEMFNSYSQQRVETHPAPEAAVPTSANNSKVGDNTSAAAASPKKSRRRRTEGAVGVHYNDGGSLTSSVEDDNSNLSHRSKNSFLAPLEIHNKVPTVEPTNLVKTLAEQDANFEAYLKLAQHQQDPSSAHDPQGKMRHKLNSSITAPRRIRKANPLGQNAINLIDSRGRASKDSRKGFSNIFQASHSSVGGSMGDDDASLATEGQGSAQKTGRTLRIDSHVNIMGTDNIMGRLKKLGTFLFLRIFCLNEFHLMTQCLVRICFLFRRRRPIHGQHHESRALQHVRVFFSRRAQRAEHQRFEQHRLSVLAHFLAHARQSRRVVQDWWSTGQSRAAQESC